MLNKVSITVVHDRKHQATKGYAAHPRKGTVQLAVIVNGTRRFISTGIHVYTDQWAAGRVVSCAQAIEYNQRIDCYISQVTDLVNQCDREGQIFSWSLLDNLYVRKHTGSSFTDFIEHIMPTRGLRPGTLKHHRKVLNFLKEQQLTDFCDLTPDRINALNQVLRSRTIGGKPIMQTTIYDYHKVIKSYVNLAIQAGLIENSPYIKVKTPKGEHRPRTVLTMDEVQRILDLKTRNLYMQHVRDLFIVQIYTGLAYADLMAADFTKIQGDTLSGYRVKTGGQYTTVILEPVKQILQRYNNRLPVMAYDCYRRMLKPMAELCGITKDFSTHCGRHTFATTIALANHVPIEYIQKMLGHKKITSTLIYAKVQDYMVQEQADRLSGLAQ
jgi:site-specific recombinase XerD